MLIAGQYLAKILQLAGTILGMWGASRMANQYTDVVRSPLDLAGVLFSALWGGPQAKGLKVVTGISQDNRDATLKGLAFVFVGFLFQSIGMLLDLFTFG